MDFFKSKEEKEQEQAEALGFADKPISAPAAVPEPKIKDPALCVVEGCQNVREPGQTYVCTAHVRAG